MIRDSKFGGALFQRLPHLPPAHDQIVHMVKFRPIFQGGKGLEHGNVVLIGCHFRHGKHQEVLVRKAQGRPFSLSVNLQISEFARVNAHTGDIFNALGRQPLLGPGVVLPVDGNKHVRHRCQQPLRWVEQQPVLRWRAGEEVEAMGSVDHPRPPLPGIQRRQPGNQGAHRGVAVDDVEVLPVNDLLEHPVGFQILRLPGHPFKGDVVIGIAVRNHAVFRVFVVVSGSHGSLPPSLLKELQVGDVKLHDVGLHHSRHEQNLFLHLPAPHIGKNGHNFTHIIHLF